MASALLLAELGCSSAARVSPSPDESLRTAIEEHVADEARRGELFDLAARFTVLLDELMAQTERSSDEIEQLLLDYDSSRRAFDAVLENYNLRREELSRRAVAIHFEARSLTTPAEWAAIEPALRHFTESKISVRLTRP